MSFVNLAGNDDSVVVKQQLTADRQQGSTGEAPGKSRSCEKDSSTTQSMEPKHDEEDQGNSSGCDRNGDPVPGCPSEDTFPAEDEDEDEDAECEDVTDGPDQCYDDLCADYDDLVIEENKIMDQVDVDFINRSKCVLCSHSHRFNNGRNMCRRKPGQRKTALERRRLRSDKVASN